MTLPDQLRAWREFQGLSQAKAADRLKIPLKTLQNWEQGVRAPSGLALRHLLGLINRQP